MNVDPPPPTTTTTTPIDTSPVSPQVRKPKVATLVAENMTVEGSITGEGELHIDGMVRGDVRVARLTIGDSGHVEGSIVCESVEIRGKVVGTVTSKQVRLYGTAHMDGDITHEQLAMEIGAFFQGRSLKFQRPAGAQASNSASTPVPQPAHSQASIAPSSAAKDTPPSVASMAVN
jgi:cytoskeletal protein CcmA (bactofilin family)